MTKKTLFCSFYVSFCTFCASLWLTRTVFSRLLKKANNHLSIILNHLYGLHSFAFYILIFAFSLTSYGISSTEDNVRKNKLFMQNKANFRKVKSNVNKVLTTDYDQMDTWSIRKTKPIQSQLKPIQSQLKPIQSQSKPIQSQLKPKRTQNEPNFKKTKMNVTSIITEAYENMSNWAICENEPKTNPNKPNFRANIMLLRLTINTWLLLWIPAFATITAISKSKDEERILVDCRCVIVDNCYINEILILSGDNMAVKNTPKLVIFGDPTKGHVAEIIEDFLDFAKGKAEVIASCGIEECTVDILQEADFAVVFGGDGSITSAARHLSQVNVPVIGVNLGKLGYLAEFNVEELKEFFPSLTSGKARTGKRMMLGCKILSKGQEKFRSAAINDAVITAGPPFKMVELKISVDDQPLAGCVSDGLIISTPTGSTAYNLSSGGPILSPKMEAMVITPMCPHSLSFRPIVINAESKVEVFGVRVNEGTTVSIDGQVSCKLSSDDVVRIERHKGDFLVVNNPLRTQWDTLATKLSWAEKPKYKSDPD